MDPYRPPKADLDYRYVEKRSVWWKVYFVVVFVLTVVSIVWQFIVWDLLWYEYLGVVTMSIALLGVYGFAFCKRIASPRFWRAYFYVLLIADIASTYLGFIDSTSEPIPVNATFVVSIAFGLLLYIPIYVALYLYGNKMRIPWTPPPEQARDRLGGSDAS